MTEVILIRDPEDEPFEYFCKECHQLRLCCLGILKKCGACGAPSERCVTGETGSLDKEALIAEQERHP